MKIKIAWYGKHSGEEPIISGDLGSGTIFFSGCNLHCQFCQNWQISQDWIGKDYTIDELVDIMLVLQKQNCLNINLVSPTIWIDSIILALTKAKSLGLKIPVVYNTNAYDDINKLKKLNNLVDIYLPDFKYGFNELGEKYSKVKNYTDVSQECILEMIKQQPNNIIDNNIMQKGVIIRHLILPNNIENTKKCIDIINSFGKNIIFSLMTQYNPTYNANKFPEINRPVNIQEYEEIMNYVSGFNFDEVFYQPLEENAKDVLNPDFNKPNPFNY